MINDREIDKVIKKEINRNRKMRVVHSEMIQRQLCQRDIERKKERDKERERERKGKK